jgi:hypothetical protein
MEIAQIILFVIILAAIGSMGYWLPIVLQLRTRNREKRIPKVCAECAHWKRMNKMSDYGTCKKNERNLPTRKDTKCLFD